MLELPNDAQPKGSQSSRRGFGGAEEANRAVGREKRVTVVRWPRFRGEATDMLGPPAKQRPAGDGILITSGYAMVTKAKGRKQLGPGNAAGNFGNFAAKEE